MLDAAPDGPLGIGCPDAREGGRTVEHELHVFIGHAELVERVDEEPHVLQAGQVRRHDHEEPVRHGDDVEGRLVEPLVKVHHDVLVHPPQVVEDGRHVVGLTAHQLRRLGRRWGQQQIDRAGVPDHGRAQEILVDGHRLDDVDDRPAAGVKVEEDPVVAELEFAVHEGGLPLQLATQGDRGVDGNGRRADAALRPVERQDAAAPPGLTRRDTRQQRPDARQQLVGMDGMHQNVIRARAQPEDLLLRVGGRRGQHDRRAAPRRIRAADLRRDADPIEPRQRCPDDDDARVPVLPEAHTLEAIRADHHLVPAGLERLPQGVAEIGVFFDYQDPRGHRLLSGAAGRARPKRPRPLVQYATRRPQYARAGGAVGLPSIAGPLDPSYCVHCHLRSRAGATAAANEVDWRPAPAS